VLLAFSRSFVLTTLIPLLFIPQICGPPRPRYLVHSTVVVVVPFSLLLSPFPAASSRLKHHPVSALDAHDPALLTFVVREMPFPFRPPPPPNKLLFLNPTPFMPTTPPPPAPKSHPEKFLYAFYYLSLTLMCLSFRTCFRRGVTPHTRPIDTSHPVFPIHRPLLPFTL